MSLFSYNDVNISAFSSTANLDKIDTWASTWSVDVNPNTKCNKNVSRRLENHLPVHLSFNGFIIIDSKTHCHLGLIFQIDARWSCHIYIWKSLFKVKSIQNAETLTRQECIN